MTNVPWETPPGSGQVQEWCCRSYWNIALCQPGRTHLWRRILLDASFETRTWNKMSPNKAGAKGFGVLGFFFDRGRVGSFCLFVYVFGFLQVFFMLIYEITITAISVLTLSWTTYFLVTNSVLGRLKSVKVQNMDVSAFHKNSFVALGQIQVYI